MADKTIIIDRNPLVVAWLESKGITGERVENLSFKDSLNAHIYGPCPFSLASVADRVSLVRIPRLAPEEHRRYMNGSMTVQEMDGHGAHIRTYKVTQIGGPSF